LEVSALKTNGMLGLRGPVRLLRLQSDERLVDLVRRGNHAAFEALVGRYRSRLLAFCRHMLGSREDAEDVLQEVFAAAFNAMLADDREINVRPWLYRIARNRCLNHLRRTSAVGVDSMDIHFADGGLSTGEKVLRREAFRDLMADVQTLPETQRTALLLREMDDMSYTEIAEAMDTTIPSVKSLLVRARVALAEAAEARRLSCDQVRLELGHVAEGLMRVTPPVRRHVRDCERCTDFRSALRANNRALAAIMPVAPLLLLKKLVLAKVGSTASASGAGAAGAGASGAGAAGSAAVGSAGSGMAGMVSAGAGAVATKAAAGLAAAALVTAGAVEVRHVANRHHDAPAVAQATHAPVSHQAVPALSAPHAVDRILPREEPAIARHPRRRPKPAHPASPKPSVPAPATLTAKAPTTPSKDTAVATPKPPAAMVGSGTTALPAPSASGPTDDTASAPASAPADGAGSNTNTSNGNTGATGPQSTNPPSSGSGTGTSGTADANPPSGNSSPPAQPQSTPTTNTG